MKILFGVFDYDGQPGVLLTDEEYLENGNYRVPDEVFNQMAEAGIEYVEETLWAWYDGTEEELHQQMLDLGFEFNQELKEDAESILG